MAVWGLAECSNITHYATIGFRPAAIPPDRMEDADQKIMGIQHRDQPECFNCDNAQDT